MMKYFDKNTCYKSYIVKKSVHIVLTCKPIGDSVNQFIIHSS